jgi:hypothetical protein
MNFQDIATNFKKINPFSATNTQQRLAQNQRDLAERFTDLGIFEYTPEGFITGAEEHQKIVVWSEIQSIIAYQSSNYRLDILWLCVVCDDAEKTFHINEDTDGWYVFLNTIAEQFPMIPYNWQYKFYTATPSILYLKDKLIRAHVLDNLSVTM